MVPHEQDISAYEHALIEHFGSGGHSGVDAVILGVTPSVALMRWPLATKVVGIELSPAVIKAIWPGDIPGTRQARCASWGTLEGMKNSCDVVVGDGSFIACRFPDEARRLVKAVRACIRDGGIFIVRIYTRPDCKESIDHLMGDLFSTRCPGVDEFKLRLYLAMQRSLSEGVAVQDAARVLDDYRIDRKVMTERFGWTLSAVEPFSIWRKSSAVYSFPSLEEFRELTGDWFSEVSITFPTYSVGTCCPILALRPK
jgi:hypothetical protein